MRKNILILGLILAVVGGLLLTEHILIVGPLLKEQTNTIDISAERYTDISYEAMKGTKLEFYFYCENGSLVDFYVLDDENYRLAVAGESFIPIDNQTATNEIYCAFDTVKCGEYHFLIDNIGAYDDSVFYRITASTYSPISLGAIGLITIGTFITSLSIMLKPSVPQRLLDIMKTRGRIKIGELAKELGTTETRVETGVNELMRAGHPIRFEAGTREVVYGSR